MAFFLHRTRPVLAVLLPLLLAGCMGTTPSAPTASAPGTACVPCQCQGCPSPALPKPEEKPLQPATWSDLPGWGDDDLAAALDGLLATCRTLEKQARWAKVCADVRSSNRNDLRAWFEARFEPWALVNPDGRRDGLVTGYYEPVVRGSRDRHAPYTVPVFGPPDDLIVVDLGTLYPELKTMRLRGRIEGRRLVPYYSRAEWAEQEARRDSKALLWLDDPVGFFFLQVQGSGQVELDDGSRVRIGYADQNGYPYRSIGRWLADRGEMPLDQTSMPNIKAWAAAHPDRLQELLNANPSLIFFRELPLKGEGPPGAMGLPMLPERSIAVDSRHTPLGAPVWLDTTRPASDIPLRRLVLAMDTGGAIRGPVRADFYWGSGPEAGAQAGRMRQTGRMWVLLPRGYAPK
ncbi:MAG: MltA domain-containing protein [Proteobacteria bacterium]|nr:MltA domain-containing protein [Pseudomonadota bacterium]HQR03929.1 MltA domain-containing protein [Rhodocyclaceae bacterium]